MTSAEEAAAWEAPPADEHKSVWDETERNFWSNLRQRQDADQAVADREFRRATTDLKTELGDLTRRRSQLSDLQQRLAKDLAKVDEELASVTDSCEEKADKLNRLEQKYHDGQQARVETCQKVVKTMRSFFRQKKGEDPDEENTHQFDLVGLASLPATDRKSVV